MKKKTFLLLLFGFLVFSGAVCERAHYDLGIFKSTDESANWQQKIKIGKKKALANQEVIALTMDPQNSQIIYAGTKGKGVFKSIDGAESWEKTSIAAGEITSIVIDPKDSNIIYIADFVGNVGKIYKSEDGGGKFSEIYSETHAQIPIYTLAIDWYDNRKIWAGTQKGAILKSDDSGRNWVVKKWLNNEVVQLAVSPNDSRHVIIGTKSNGLWKTEDEGKTFQEINKNFLTSKDENNKQKLQTHALVFSPIYKKTVYFASQYQLLRSKDEGKKWEEIKLLTRPGEASLMKIALDPIDPKKIYVGLDSNLYKSEDGGKNWVVKKITSGRIAILTIDSKDPKIIYLGARKPKE